MSIPSPTLFSGAEFMCQPQFLFRPHDMCQPQDLGLHKGGKCWKSEKHQKMSENVRRVSGTNKRSENVKNVGRVSGTNKKSEMSEGIRIHQKTLENIRRMLAEVGSEVGSKYGM